MVVTPHSHCATALFTGYINRGLVRQRNAVAQHVHTAAPASGGCDRACAFNIGVAACLEHDLAAFQTGRGCLDQSAVPERAGKDGDRVALERTQIDGLIRGRLHFHADAFQATSCQFDLLPGCQYGAAVGRLDQRIFSGINGTAQQYNIATARQYPALHRYACA